MKFKLLSARHLISQLTYYWKKRLILFYFSWKAAKQNRSRIPRHLSINLNPTNEKILNEALNTRIKRPKSVSFQESPNFGERLHEKAKEIEKKKESMRKSLEIEYSFTPKLSGTPKWLSGKGRGSQKTEEIAVVSGNSVLQYTSCTPNFQGIIEKNIFWQKEIPHKKVLRVIKQNRDRPGAVPGFIEGISKENYFNSMSINK